MILELMFIMMMLIMGVITIYLIIAWMKTHRLRIRDPIKQSMYIEEYWVWEVKDKISGAMYWKSVLWQPKLYTAKPPERAIEVGRKGRKYAEAYRLSEDQFCWIEDKGIKIVDQATKSGKTEKVIVDVQKDGQYQYVDTFKPFSTVQRDALISQMKKAEEISKGRWTADKMIVAGSIGMFFILIMLIIIFWGDIAQPVIDIQSGANGMVQTAEKITRNQAIIMQNLGLKTDGLNMEITQTPEPATNQLPQTDPLADPLDIYRKK